MTKRDRRDGDRRPSDRRDVQPDDEQQRHPGEADTQEGDSLTALKAILAKVAALLAPLKLTQDESISLVEQLYGRVLEMDLKLAGETDDKRKSSVLAYITDTKIVRKDGKIVVEYPAEQDPAGTAGVKSAAEAKESEKKQSPAKPAAEKKDDAPKPAPEPAPEPASEPQQASAATSASDLEAKEKTAEG